MYSEKGHEENLVELSDKEVKQINDARRKTDPTYEFNNQFSPVADTSTVATKITEKDNKVAYDFIKNNQGNVKNNGDGTYSVTSGIETESTYKGAFKTNQYRVDTQTKTTVDTTGKTTQTTVVTEYDREKPLDKEQFTQTRQDITITEQKPPQQTGKGQPTPQKPVVIEKATLYGGDGETLSAEELAKKEVASDADIKNRIEDFEGRKTVTKSVNTYEGETGEQFSERVKGLEKTYQNILDKKVSDLKENDIITWKNENGAKISARVIDYDSGTQKLKYEYYSEDTKTWENDEITIPKESKINEVTLHSKNGKDITISTAEHQINSDDIDAMNKQREQDTYRYLSTPVMRTSYYASGKKEWAYFDDGGPNAGKIMKNDGTGKYNEEFLRGGTEFASLLPEGVFGAPDAAEAEQIEQLRTQQFDYNMKKSVLGFGDCKGGFFNCMQTFWGQIGAYMGTYNQFNGIGAMGALFIGDEKLAERREKLAKDFCAFRGIASCFVSEICVNENDLEPTGMLATIGPGGKPSAVAHIEGDKSLATEFYNETTGKKTWKMFYRVTYSLVNPLDKPMTYNILFVGSAGEIPWFTDQYGNRIDATIDKGQSHLRSSTYPIATYSTRSYDQVCIDFNPSIEKTNGKKTSRICNSIIVGNTEITQEAAQAYAYPAAILNMTSTAKTTTPGAPSVITPGAIV